MELPARGQISPESPPKPLLPCSVVQSNKQCSLARRVPTPQRPSKSQAVGGVRNSSSGRTDRGRPLGRVAKYTSQKGVGCNNIPSDLHSAETSRHAQMHVAIGGRRLTPARQETWTSPGPGSGSETTSCSAQASGGMGAIQWQTLENTSDPTIIRLGAEGKQRQRTS